VKNQDVRWWLENAFVAADVVQCLAEVGPEGNAQRQAWADHAHIPCLRVEEARQKEKVRLRDA
jgi:hypothetical protein